MKHKRPPKILVLLVLPILIFIGVIGFLISCATPTPKYKQVIVKSNDKPSFIILSSESQ